MYDTINRDVLILFPKQPLFDWVNKIFPDDKLDCPELMAHDEANVYLIPETDYPEAGLVYLKKNFKTFFELELEEWSLDENTWPQKLTWKLFQGWFHFSIQSMVTDMVNVPIVKHEL